MQGNIALCNPNQRNVTMGNTSKHHEVITPQFYRLPQLKMRLGVSGSSIWAWVKKGTFPAPIKLAENTTAWHILDIEKWENARIAANNNNDGESHE